MEKGTYIAIGMAAGITGAVFICLVWIIIGAAEDYIDERVAAAVAEAVKPAELPEDVQRALGTVNYLLEGTAKGQSFIVSPTDPPVAGAVNIVPWNPEAQPASTPEKEAVQ